MKTAVSIPDDVYENAEALARQLKMSRSRLYADALRDFVARRRSEAITESWNRVVDELGEDAVDRAWLEIGLQTLARVEWKD